MDVTLKKQEVWSCCGCLMFGKHGEWKLSRKEVQTDRQKWTLDPAVPDAKPNWLMGAPESPFCFCQFALDFLTLIIKSPKGYTCPPKVLRESKFIFNI